MILLLAAYIAVGLEAWKIMSLRGTGTYSPYIIFLVLRKELTDPVKESPLSGTQEKLAT